MEEQKINRLKKWIISFVFACAQLIIIVILQKVTQRGQTPVSFFTAQGMIKFLILTLLFTIITFNMLNKSKDKYCLLVLLLNNVLLILYFTFFTIL